MNAWTTWMLLEGPKVASGTDLGASDAAPRPQLGRREHRASRPSARAAAAEPSTRRGHRDERRPYGSGAA